MSKRINYLDNDETYIELCFWKLKIYAYNDTNIRPPDELGRAIQLTTEGMSRHVKFHRYTWKEDMIGDGVESMIKGLFNFNEQKFKNPHAYMSMSAENAFLQRMEKEDRELLATYKTFLRDRKDDFEREGFINTRDDEKFVQDMADKVTEIESSINRKKYRRKMLKLKRDLSPLAEMVYGDDYIDKINQEIKKTETFYTSKKINYGERGRILITVESIKEELGIKLGSICVGDVVDFLVEKRQMNVDEDMNFDGAFVDINFITIDGVEFVDINWGLE